MKSRAQLLLALLALPGGLSCATQQEGLHAALSDADAGPVWIVKTGDSICGLDDPRMLSAPARLQFDRIYRSTPEVRRMEAEGIAPDSATGILLHQQALDRIYRTCEFVRNRDGYCSIWKAIRHVDGRPIPDVTDKVLPIL